MSTQAAPPAPTPEACAVALDQLHLPTRLARWAHRKGLSTLGELARIAPTALRGERNLGRRSIAGARGVIEERLGVPWERFAAGKGAEEPPAADTDDDGPPPAVPDLALDDLDLPTRMTNWARLKGLSTLGELARISPAELLAEKNLGRLTLHQTRVVLEPRLGCSWELAAGVGTSARAEREAIAAAAVRLTERYEALAAMPLLEAWRSVLPELAERDRTIIAAHAGLDGRVERLAAIAARLGLRPGTTGTIEHRAVAALRRRQAWLAVVRARVDAALASHGGAAPLSTLAEDPLWAGIAALPKALDYLGRRVLQGACRVVRVEERAYLARCSQEVLDEAWRALDAGAALVSLPAPLASFRALLDPWEPRIHAALAEALLARLRAELLVDEAGGAPQVTGRATPLEASILAKLLASPVPVRIPEKRLSTLWAHLPGDVLKLGVGVLGLPRHFPSYDAWRELLVPAAIRVMERGAPERQWLARELRQQLGEELDIPAWLTEWHLGSLLMRSGKVRGFGYMRFVLPGAPEGQGSVTVREELVRLLRARGGPMMRRELVQDLRRRMGASEETISLSLHHPPFMRLARSCYGLLDRDLPGRAKARAKAVEHVAALLAQRGLGLGARPLQVALAGLSPAHARWTREMCLSALRGDPRFVQSVSGAVGLSIWESVRLPSREELARECLKRGHGRVRLSTLARRIEETYGDPPSQKQLWAIAGRLGASVGEGWLVHRGGAEGTAAGGRASSETSSSPGE